MRPETTKLRIQLERAERELDTLRQEVDRLQLAYYAAMNADGYCPQCPPAILFATSDASTTLIAAHERGEPCVIRDPINGDAVVFGAVTEEELAD